jgi:alkanesulfonate monooxygenase SsuD/methylene tetrahydromethanopterin reductase-like flavin-dependent oxidoreductase (luciferase family)
MAASETDAAIRFGISVVPAVERVEAIRDLVRYADSAGVQLVGIQDHPYQRHFVDTWSLVGTLIAETRDVSFFTDVASLPLRPPAVMAKAAATLDILSGGRFELGLGGGAQPELMVTSRSTLLPSGSDATHTQSGGSSTCRG